MKLIEFNGAKIGWDDDSGEKTFTDRGNITIAENQIVGVYDHVILLAGDQKIWVMETYEEILAKLAG